MHGGPQTSFTTGVKSAWYAHKLNQKKLARETPARAGNHRFEIRCHGFCPLSANNTENEKKCCQAHTQPQHAEIDCN